jgi:choline transport protein
MMLVLIVAIGLGAIPLGSSAAFVNLTGSFIILTSTSYAIPIAGHLLSKRKSLKPGYFWMGKAGFAMQAITLVLITFFNIFFCFRKFSKRPANKNCSLIIICSVAATFPTTTATMNYNAVILVGVLALTTMWWFIHQKKYAGPALMMLHTEGVTK